MTIHAIQNFTDMPGSGIQLVYDSWEEQLANYRRRLQANKKEGPHLPGPYGQGARLRGRREGTRQARQLEATDHGRALLPGSHADSARSPESGLRRDHEVTDMTGPSERAVEAAAKVLAGKDGRGTDWHGGWSRDMLAAAHDPALGEDASVRRGAFTEAAERFCSTHHFDAPHVHAFMRWLEREHREGRLG
jgi:hypothetical protein